MLAIVLILRRSFIWTAVVAGVSLVSYDFVDVTSDVTDL